jgi:thiamine-monophosphate kinase
MGGGGDARDEFAEIARLYRPLTRGSQEALDLLDDVAVLPSRPGYDLVVTKDAMVEGVHFLSGEPLDLVAGKLLRVNLSDLAAKAAEPHGYLLAVAWPHGTSFEAKASFADGLAQAQDAFDVRLLGGDTVSTSGPLVASLTLLGWTPAGRLVKRKGARPGDILFVSGTIGDAGLGLDRLKAGGPCLDADQALVARHRSPTPRLELRGPLRRFATAAADVSDGLLADANHIADASGCGLRLDLSRLPLSEPAAAWLETQADPTAARLTLATSGDDYEIVCTASAADGEAFMAAAREAGVVLTPIGEAAAGAGLQVHEHARPVAARRLGWTHG